MPEGGSPAEQPAGVDKQVDGQIAVGRISRQLGTLFGQGWQHESGGGGAGGSYEFTSLAELDGLIAQFKTELEAIQRDGRTIAQAARLAVSPADDGMSNRQAEATRRSLEAMLHHNSSMNQYAVAEIVKLEEARKNYELVEQNNAEGMGRAGKA